MILIKSINSYIAKNFLVKLFQTALGFSLISLFINLIDTLDKAKGSEVPLDAIFFMSILKIPSFLDDISSSLILISAISSFFTLSSKSEITITRISGLSLWQIIKPIAVPAFIVGVLWTILLQPTEVKMIKKFNYLEGKYMRNEVREFVAPENGIWLKQTNLENPSEEIILQAHKVYKENLEFDKASFWFVNNEGEFYQRIDSEKAFLKENNWIVNNAVLNNKKLINNKIPLTTIPTDLKPDFIIQKVINNFQDEKSFSFFELIPLIKNLDSSGFSSTKFKVYFYSLINRPFLFMAMTLIACYFGINHVRNNNSILLAFLGIILGLMVYIISSIINNLGSSGLISVFASTWLITIIFFAIGTLLIYEKELI